MNKGNLITTSSSPGLKTQGTSCRLLVKPDYVVIATAPEFGRPVRIKCVSEVFNQKKECICHTVFLFESCEWHEGVTLTSKNVLIYKLDPSLDRE